MDKEFISFEAGDFLFVLAEMEYCFLTLAIVLKRGLFFYGPEGGANVE